MVLIIVSPVRMYSGGGGGQYHGLVVAMPRPQIIGTFRGLRFTAEEPLTDKNIPV